MRLPPNGELLERARKLTKEEVDTVMWFCVACCGVSSWAQFAQLIMRCEREDATLEIIERWHECQHGKERDYRVVKSVQEKVFPLIQEYKYAQHR
jgi:hypothetical protein